MTKARDLANGGFGLVLVKPSTVVNGTDNGKGTVSFSAASTVSLNGVFNSTYDNYRVIFNLIGVSTSNTIGMKYRVNNTDTSTLYYAQGTAVVNGSTASASSNTNTASIDILPSLDSGSAGISFAIIEFINPFPVSTNKYNFQTLEGRAGYTSRSGSGTIAEANKSYDGFTLLTSTGTMTGSVSVYGYNK
jgi:hypothetical protein